MGRKDFTLVKEKLCRGRLMERMRNEPLRVNVGEDKEWSEWILGETY